MLGLRAGSTAAAGAVLVGAKVVVLRQKSVLIWILPVR